MRPQPVLLMVRELGLGGSERQAAEIARALDRSRFEAHVGCFRPNGFRADDLREAGVPVAEFPVRSFVAPSVLAGAAAFGRYVRQHGIELVHSFDQPSNLFAVPVARAYGAPRVVSSQRAHRELAGGMRRHLVRLTDLMVDAIVVNCLSVQRQLVEQEKVPASRIRLCYNGLDTAVFRHQRGPRPEALSDACLVIGVVCALRPEKSIDVLLRAFAAVREFRPGLKLAIVGSGPEGGRLTALAGELGVAGQCHFEPATGSVAEWLRGIDIFVLPSRSEAFSNSLMEAMASGCCAVASDTGGNPELVERGRTGLLFAPGDAGALAECLRLVLENDALRHRLAQAGAERIHNDFSLGAAARAMGAIYESVLEGGV
ncbi:MAG TPA: glycosyltransferase family 4 protein [Bryobacteraceae bacterium]|nr:glycosyltransferase family 4 protein [Bryobacteraceae bacterium]